MLPAETQQQRMQKEDFDMWIKMATDNKINSVNSWNFALIDYFHDLSVLREGDQINFQKASATLDGCVKIYSSRIDSAATETGKLLSGLSTNRLDRKEAGDDDEEADDADEQETKTRKRNVKKKAESTLAKSQDALKAKKMDTELSVDPLFKKALTDFDEGGSKSLLLHMLKVDGGCRVVFDTTGVFKTETTEKATSSQQNCDVSGLRRFFPTNLEDFSVCPSMRELEAISNSGDGLTTLLQSMDNVDYADDEPPEEVDFDDIDVPADTGTPMRSHFSLVGENDDELSGQTKAQELIQFDEDEPSMADNHMMEYFDNLNRGNWSGADSWKVARLKKSFLRPPALETPAATKNIKKAHLRIDFLTEDDPDLFAKGTSITLPKSKWICETRHLLPEDKQFTTRRLIHLSLKPSKLINTPIFNKKRKQRFENDFQRADENFFAENFKDFEKEGELSRLNINSRINDIIQQDLDEIHQSFDDNFFNDDEENLEPAYLDGLGEIPEPAKETGFGSQLIASQSRFKPNSINFARVAKKVDVKLLKDNLWDSLSSLKERTRRNDAEKQNMEEDTHKSGNTQMNFTEVVEELSTKYTPTEKANLSTSFCFICLLHLANENGLSLESNKDYSDLVIK